MQGISNSAAMAAAAESAANQLMPMLQREPEQPRRFQLPDIDRHAGWLFARMGKIYPHLNERQANGWLRSVLGSNEFMFLFLPHGVALFQSWHSTLDASPVIKQHFVWVCDPANKDYQVECAEFYVEIKRWAARMRINKLIDIEMNNDVPIDLVRKRLGRVNTREQLFAQL